MPLRVWAGVAEVVATLPGPGRIELYALKRAGESTPALVLEAYDAESMVAGGEVAVWELNQAIAALLSASSQARRLSLRDDGRHHGGYLDLVAGDESVDVVVSSADGQRRVAFATTAPSLAADLNALVRHYLTLSRAVGVARTIVLPDAVSADLASR
jgi:hypothetical protein